MPVGSTAASAHKRRNRGLELPAASAMPQPEPPHSVLTIGLIDRDGEPTREAVNRVLSFLAERLR